MRLSAAVVIKTNINRPQSGKRFTGSHQLSINDVSDGKIITFINFNLRSFKHLGTSMERLEGVITDRPD